MEPVEKILICEEAAKILRVSEEHVRSLVRKGHLEAYKEGRKGGYRILESAISKYVNYKKQEQQLLIDKNK